MSRVGQVWCPCSGSLITELDPLTRDEWKRSLGVVEPRRVWLYVQGASTGRGSPPVGVLI